jgi:hypothetical protein
MAAAAGGRRDRTPPSAPAHSTGYADRGSSGQGDEDLSVALRVRFKLCGLGTGHQIGASGLQLSKLQALSRDPGTRVEHKFQVLATAVGSGHENVGVARLGQHRTAQGGLRWPLDK